MLMRYQYVLEMHVDLDLEEFEMTSDEKNIKVPFIVTLDEGFKRNFIYTVNYDEDDEVMKRKEYFCTLLNFYQD